MQIDRNFLPNIHPITTPLISSTFKRLFLEKALRIVGKIENQLIPLISKLKITLTKKKTATK
jgi:hypothetical protein